MDGSVNPAADLQKLASFLVRLRKAGIYSTVTTVREGALMVEISVPGEHWEVEFLEDGNIDIERFVKLLDETALDDLFQRFSD